MEGHDESWVVSVNPSQKTSAHEIPLILAKVHRFLRQSKPGAYDPLLFSFGPYHGTLKGGSSREQDFYKFRAIASAATKKGARTGTAAPEKVLEELACKILSRDRELSHIRDVYVDGGEELRTIKPEALANLLALDALSLVSFFWTQERTLASVLGAFRLDAMRVENQIPLWLLLDAVEVLFPGSDAVQTILPHMVDALLCQVNPFRSANCSSEIPEPINTFRPNDVTLLGCLYDVLTGNCGSGITPSPSKGTASVSIKPASGLKAVGLKFKAIEGPVFNGISFERGDTLVLPRVTINGETEVVLRNLIAYEMMDPVEHPERLAVRSYVRVMGYLIDSEKDVEVLEKSGVIDNQLGSKAEVATMFNGLYKHSAAMTAADWEVLCKVEVASHNRMRVAWANFLQRPLFFIGICLTLALLIVSR